MLRLSSIVRLGALAFVVVFLLHFLASFFSSSPDPSPYYDAGPYGGDLDDGIGWGERLGLDHYASWEEDVRGKVGAGLGRLKDGVGSITGLGAKGPKLGSLYEVRRRPAPASSTCAQTVCADTTSERGPRTTRRQWGRLLDPSARPLVRSRRRFRALLDLV